MSYFKYHYAKQGNEDSLSVSQNSVLKIKFYSSFRPQTEWSATQGDRMFLWKNRSKTKNNLPSSRPTIFLLNVMHENV
jgi:hypothetical protein